MKYVQKLLTFSLLFVVVSGIISTDMRAMEANEPAKKRRKRNGQHAGLLAEPLLRQLPLVNPSLFKAIKGQINNGSFVTAVDLLQQNKDTNIKIVDGDRNSLFHYLCARMTKQDVILRATIGGFAGLQNVRRRKTTKVSLEDVRALVGILRSKGLDINATNKQGLTPLALLVNKKRAVSSDFIQLIELMLKAGARVDQQLLKNSIVNYCTSLNPGVRRLSFSPQINKSSKELAKMNMHLFIQQALFSMSPKQKKQLFTFLCSMKRLHGKSFPRDVQHKIMSKFLIYENMVTIPVVLEDPYINATVKDEIVNYINTLLERDENVLFTGEFVPRAQGLKKK